MAEGQDFDAAGFADQLSAMTDGELFALMQKLEDESEDIPSEVIAKRRLAYDRDPDPAEDVEEPANDWPAAVTPAAEVKE